jgi:DNA adenine methylase
MKSPLRYPGGKHRATKYLLEYVPKNLNEIVSPFFGGGSLELKIAQNGIRVYGYDIFLPVVRYWNDMKHNRELLINNSLDIQTKMNKQYFRDLQNKLKNNQIKEQDMGSTFFCLNRASFSGTVLSGGYSPDHPRFNIRSIDSMKNIDMSLISVEHMDFVESIQNNKDKFLYCDPPYMLKTSNLYGKAGDLHKDFDHKKLHQLLTSREKWILSYNDCEEIRDLYKDFNILTPSWKYGMSENKDSKELLILNI